MDHLRQLESVLAIFMASFEIQMESIYQLGKGHQFRAIAIYQLKRLLTALLSATEANERQFIEEVEHQAEDVLNASAKVMSSVGSVAQVIEMPENVVEVMKTHHKTLTRHLSDSEEEATKVIMARFTTMKDNVRKALARLDNL